MRVDLFSVIQHIVTQAVKLFFLMLPCITLFIILLWNLVSAGTAVDNSNPPSASVRLFRHRIWPNDEHEHVRKNIHNLDSKSLHSSQSGPVPLYQGLRISRDTFV